jgi:hypothetical protein
MAITLLQSAKKDVKNVNNTTLAFNQALQQARLLVSSVITFESTATTTITFPTDTLSHVYLAATNQQDNADNKTHLRTFYVPSTTAGSDTVTADISGTATGEITMINSEWSGVDTATPISGTPVLAGPTVTTTPATGTITPSDHGCLLIAVLTAGGNSITIDISPTSLADGWQQLQEYEGCNASKTLSVIYKIQEVASPASASWVISSDQICLSHIIAFKPLVLQLGEEELSDQIGSDRYRDPVLAGSMQAPWVTSTGSPYKRVTTTVPFDVHQGDLLVEFGLAQTDTLSEYEFSGGFLTWTQQALENRDPGAGSTQGVVILATALVDFQKRMSVTLTRAVFAGTARFGALVMIYRNSSGIGTIEKAIGDSSTATLSIDVMQPHSDIVMAVVDNNAVSGASRTWRQTAGALTELTYYLGGMAVYSGYHTNIVKPSRHTVGLLTPAGQQYSMIAAEVRGNPVPDNSIPVGF